MAKDIKAIQCPHCGSTDKTETKPDFYRCKNCGTEYFLDSDDVHIYHHHQRSTPTYSSSPPVNSKLPVFVLLGAVLFIVVLYFVSIALQPKKTNTTFSLVSSYKPPRMYYSSFVYTNTATGEPVYLRLGSDYIDKGNGKGEREMHARYDNALSGKMITDKVINADHQSKGGCMVTFKTFSPDLIYGIDCSATLLFLDARNNRLIDVTQTLFKDYPELSSGVGKLEFDYSRPMINIMSNDGNSYHYFPEKKRLIADAEQADKFWKKEFDRHYFEFGSLGSPFDQNRVNQLIENKYSRATGNLQQRDLTPGRKYFDPKILYQDDHNVLIVVNTTAAADPPVTIQSIDAQTGKLLWALPPDTYNLYSASRWKNGFAVEYRHGDEADYVHGVLVISDAGKLVHNYQLARTE